MDKQGNSHAFWNGWNRMGFIKGIKRAVYGFINKVFTLLGKLWDFLNVRRGRSAMQIVIHISPSESCAWFETVTDCAM